MNRPEQTAWAVRQADETKLYMKLDRKASTIVTKLRNKVASSGYYENLGQNELRKFSDEVNGTDLPYQAKYQLKSMLSQAIDTI